MKKLFFPLLIALLIPFFSNALASSQTTYNVTPMYNIYNNYVTSITQINVIYTHEERKICENDDRFLELYKNYNKYVLNKNKWQQEMLLNRVKKELEGLEEKWLLWNLDTFKGLCDAQQDFITFMVQEYVHNHDIIDYKMSEVSKYLTKADSELNSWNLLDAVESYKLVLYALESLEWYEDLEKEVQSQIDTLWEMISKEHSWSTTIIKSKSSNIDSDSETKKENDITEEVAKAKEELWTRAAIFESLVPLFKAKDQKTQENVKALLKVFESSKDTYTRNIGIYFWYLVQ